MGWLEDIGDAVSEAADTVAEVVQAVVETAGDVVADVIETAGNAAQDGLTALGGRRGWLPGFVAAWLGGVVAGFANLSGAIIKAVSGIISGVVGGLIRVVGGIFSLDLALIAEGLVDIFSGIVGGVFYVVGTLLSLGQRIITVQNNERSLTKAEKTMLRKVFFNSISLYNIRVIQGESGVFGIFSNTGMTLGNSIYMKDIDMDSVDGHSILVHESVHVWQYQNLGSRYTADALGARVWYGNPYNWRISERARGNSDWTEFNKEGQAEFMQDLWNYGSLTFNGHSTTGRGSFFDLQDVQSRFDNGTAEFILTNRNVAINHTELATQAVKSLRGRINLRWSRDL